MRIFPKENAGSEKLVDGVLGKNNDENKEASEFDEVSADQMQAVAEEEAEKYNMPESSSASGKLFNDEMGIIAKGTTVHGSVKTSGHLAVAGVVEGDVSCAGNLMLTGEICGQVECNSIILESNSSFPVLKVRENVSIKENTEFKGDISCKNISVMGKIIGKVNASGNVGVSKGAIIEGDITAAVLAIEPGAKIKGYVNII